MREKKIVVIQFLLAGLLTSSMAMSQAAPIARAGTACSKKGSVQVVGLKKFTCTTVGKKLLWDKGFEIVKTTSTTSATPTPTVSASPAPVLPAFIPWSSTFLTQSMTTAALTNTSNYLGTVKPSNSYKLFMDAAITSADKEWIVNALDYTNGAFSEILQGQVEIFLGTNHEWSANTLRSVGEWVGDPRSPYPCSNGGADAYCATPNLVLLIYSDVYAQGSGHFWDVGRRSTPAHEMFHNVQFALGGRSLGPDDPAHIPRWLMEGSANYFGYYIIDKLAFNKYEAGRKQQVTYNYAYATVVPLAQYDNFTSDPYGIGQAASEYIIASAGFESLLNIWKFTKSEGNFEKGFKKATGLELADFYSKFEEARASMKIGNP